MLTSNNYSQAEVMERRLLALLFLLLGLMVDGTLCNCIYKPKRKHSVPAHSYFELALYDEYR